MPLPAALSHAGSALLGGLLLLMLALALFAVVDVPLQRHRWRRRLKMSPGSQAGDKESEGNVEVKGRMRRACARWPTAACWPRCPGPTWW